ILYLNYVFFYTFCVALWLWDCPKVRPGSKKGVNKKVLPSLFEQVKVTESALAKVKELIDEEGNPHLKLRVFVTGGGCSGFQYGFAFDEACAEDDATVEKS